MYNVVNQDSVVSTDKKHKLAKKDNRFLEVFYNGEVIYIRKSTLVWILQEGERVSGDHLFRVRVKQPYSSTKQLIPPKLAESTTPQVQECVNIGDFCVFLDSSVNKWSIGRVDQFSKYKEKLKSERQFKDSKAPISNSSNIGALCTWFTCSTDRRSTFVYSNTKAIDYIPISKSYVCTLPAGCFSQVSSEGSAIVRHSMIGSQLSAKLHTASTLTVNDDAISFINKCIISDEKENEVINLCDNDDETKEDRVKEVPVWVTTTRSKLTIKEKNILENGKQLTDLIINYSCSILKKQFSEFGGFQSTLLQNSLLHSALPNQNNIVQVIHMEKEKHWAVISTDYNSNISFYDSVFNRVSMSTEQAIVSLLKPSSTIRIYVKNVAKQRGSSDCGIYAIAYCTLLVNNINPCSVVLQQIEMRHHLKMCLERGYFTTFPLVNKNRRLTSQDSLVHIIEICPVCHLSDDGNLMVSCDTCKRWFHQDCLHLPIFNEDDDWKCVDCVAA